MRYTRGVNNERHQMKISKMKIKFLGKIGYVFRVLNASGELIGCYDSQEEAEAFVNAA